MLAFNCLVSAFNFNLIVISKSTFITITAFSYAEFNRVNFISLTRVFCVSLTCLHLNYKHCMRNVNKKLIIFFLVLIFSKSFLFCKGACKRLFIRLSLVFAFGLIRYSYRTSNIYTCMDVVNVLFLVGLHQIQEDK